MIKLKLKRDLKENTQTKIEVHQHEMETMTFRKATLPKRISADVHSCLDAITAIVDVTCNANSFHSITAFHFTFASYTRQSGKEVFRFSTKLACCMTWQTHKVHQMAGRRNLFNPSEKFQEGKRKIIVDWIPLYVIIHMVYEKWTEIADFKIQWTFIWRLQNSLRNKSLKFPIY